ncbi:MAG: TIGR03960 family B12-binding radical SAM protein [Candidatus Melainabacteria bacterium]|nr:TIGR03960 family B12-binding radical SAM protein [Candidatus Melainabacteria bacterium]
MQETILKNNEMQHFLDTQEKNTYYNLVNNLLLKVQKPGQYLGIEWGHLVGREAEVKVQEKNNLKSWTDTRIHAALIYPDLYELGMANFGTKILYQIINSHKDFLCDRAYAPMKDMEELLRKNNFPLWGWESFQPLNRFDLLGVSLSYELSYTNVLNILELSGLEVLSKDRKSLFPLIFAGGPATFNPEPMADFIDFFIVGDGEEVIIEVLELIKNEKQNDLNTAKDELLLKIAQISGIYVPKFYTPNPNENYLPKPVPDLENKIPKKITKRVVSLTDLNQPISGPVPYLSSVQDRQTMEIRRGCDRGCRFCQPGYVYLPVRERTPEQLVKLSTEALKNTGYDEYSLLSLSASDYTQLHEAALSLNNAHAEKGISLSMPSQRADRFDLKIANELNTVRKSGITLAPEAGTERLREVINKGLKEEDIKKAIENVYDSGFNRVKLYFMIGLPTETFSDLDGIIELLRWTSNLSKIKNKRPLDITCTISTFVPKAFTPFQWFSQNTKEEFQEKINYLKQKVKEYRLRNVKLNCTDPKIALLEAVLSRGDRRMSELVYKAYRNGAKFDAWDECLNMEAWQLAGNEIGLDLHCEATRHREVGSLSPWDVIDSGLLNKFLIEEYNKAVKVSETAPCTENSCHACGVCFELGVLNEVTVDRSKNNKFVKTISQATVNSKPISHDKLPSISKTSLPVKTVQKIEIVHTKNSALRFISHLDIQRLFERALRRAEIPISFSEGFNPRPKMQWLMPLPLYYESDHELMHLELSGLVKDLDLQVLLNKQLPEEIQVRTAKNVDLRENLPNIENVKVLYKVLTCNPVLWEKYICEAKTAIDSFLAQNSLILKVFKKHQDKKNQSEKQLDIRPLVERITILNSNPFELELLLIGNTRAELVLDFITKQVLGSEKTETENVENLQNNFFQWQENWKIKKETVINRS